MFTRLRKSSWVVGVASLLLPVGFAAMQLQEFQRWAVSQGGFVCGMPVVAIYVLAAVASAALSLVATGLALVAHGADSQPSSTLRRVEVFALATPFLAASAILAVLFGASHALF